MLLLISTTDKIQLVTNAAVTVDVHASYIDYSGSTITPGRTNTAISTATTTDIIAAPASSTSRSVRKINIKNIHSNSQVNITVQHIASGGTAVKLFTATLYANEEVVFSDFGWTKYDINGMISYYSAAKLDLEFRVDIDQAFAPAGGVSDIGEFSAQVKSNKKYAFIAHLFHTSSASTNGVRCTCRGPTMTDIQFGNIQVVTNSVTAATLSSGCQTTANTPATSDTAGQTATGLTILAGSFWPAENGRFSIRVGPEVANAAGLTIKIGSWFKIWELDN